MRPPEALKRLAQAAYDAARTVGLRDAKYPATNLVDNPPELHVFWRDSDITHGNDRQYWIIQAEGQIYVAKRGDTKREIKRADDLIVPIVDAFAATQPAFKLRSSADTETVDHCMVVRVVPSVLIEYAGHEYHAGQVFWQIKLQRRAGEA